MPLQLVELFLLLVITAVAAKNALFRHIKAEHHQPRAGQPGGGPVDHFGRLHITLLHLHKVIAYAFEEPNRAVFHAAHQNVGWCLAERQDSFGEGASEAFHLVIPAVSAEIGDHL